MTTHVIIRLPDPQPSGHRAVGTRLFIDGAERAVYEDSDGRQYVCGLDGEPIYGQWLIPADQPLVVRG